MKNIVNDFKRGCHHSKKNPENIYIIANVIIQSNKIVKKFKSQNNN